MTRGATWGKELSVAIVGAVIKVKSKYTLYSKIECVCYMSRLICAWMPLWIRKFSESCHLYPVPALCDKHGDFNV